MKKVLIGLVFVFCALVLSSCINKGRVGTEEIADKKIILQIKEGKSSKTEVKTLLGKPAHVSFTDLGEEEWLYSYGTVAIDPVSFIPIVGLFLGGTDVEGHSLTVRFTKEGIVKNVGQGETISRMGSSRGFKSEKAEK